MSESDKTGEKLVASMRKTRAGAEPKPAAAQKSAAAAKKKTSAKRGSTTAARKPKQPVIGGDPYQTGRRVWPD